MFGQSTNELPYTYPYPSFHHQYDAAFLPIPEEVNSLSTLRSELGHTSSSYGAASFAWNSEPFYPSDTFPVRKAISTGDLTGQNGQRSNSPVATESSILESMNRASPYSPEEKKERIERYRNKRNLRNFNKKIKYECRKTLADSRPRIKGRFARNDEVESDNHNKSDQTQLWDLSYLTGVEEYDEEDENWIGFLDAFSANLMP